MMLVCLFNNVIGQTAEIRWTDHMPVGAEAKLVAPAHPPLPANLTVERPLGNGEFARLTIEFKDRGSGPYPEATRYRCEPGQAPFSVEAEVAHALLPGQAPRFGHRLLGLTTEGYKGTTSADAENRFCRERDLSLDLRDLLVQSLSGYRTQAGLRFAVGAVSFEQSGVRQVQFRAYDVVLSGQVVRRGRQASDETIPPFNFGVLYVPEPVFARVGSSQGARLPTDLPGAFVSDGQTLRPLDGKALEDLGATIAVADMNGCSLELGPSVPPNTRICINPGTLLIPEDPNAQTMVVLERMAITKKLIPMASTQPIGDAQKVYARVISLEMGKSEPDGAVRYRIGGTISANLENLAWFSSRYSGPGFYDQFRFWIATESATLDEVRKRMGSKTKEGIYLTSLFEAVRYARLDIADPKLARCLTPHLLLGRSATGEATEWATETLARTRTAELLEWFRTRQRTFDTAIRDDESDGTAKHLAAIAAGAFASGSDEAKDFFLDYLLTVPKGVGPFLSSPKFGLRLIQLIRNETNEARLLKAVDLCALAGPRTGFLPLISLRESAPEAVREKVGTVLQSWANTSAN